MTFYKKLTGQKCYLAPYSPADAEKWAEWFTDLEVTLPLGDEAYMPTSADDQRTSIQQMTQHHTHAFNIVDLESDALIGRCLLFNVNSIDRHAMLGIVIGEKSYWGQGYGQDALKLLLDYGFNLLNLNNIMLGVFSFNQRAIAAYKKVGFQEIGRRRKARIIGGVMYDTIFMDILAEEFESVYVKSLMQTLQGG